MGQENENKSTGGNVMDEPYEKKPSSTSSQIRSTTDGMFVHPKDIEIHQKCINPFS